MTNARVLDAAHRLRPVVPVRAWSTATALRRRLLKFWFRRLHVKYRHRTMVPKPVFVSNLILVDSMRSIDGCVVECGVWRGGMSAAIAEVLGPQRKYFLFDSFQGLPPATDADGPGMKAWQADVQGPTYYNNCSASQAEAEASMRKSGATNFSLVKGWFEDTVPAFSAPEPIALLRLDGDLYDSTKVCLEHLWPQLAPGALLIIDDYGAWDGCARAVHEFLTQKTGSTGRMPRLWQFENHVFYLRF